MPRPPSDIADRILEAARERFLAQGVDGASLRRIAEDAGTSIGMVYYYYKTKDELFFAVVEDVYGTLLSDFARALATDVPPEQRVRRIYERAAALDEREFKVVRLMLREALISSDRLARIARRFQQGHIPLVLRTLEEGTREGRFDPHAEPIAMAMATAALGILPQLAHRLISSANLPAAQLLPTREQTAHACWQLLLRGIAGPSLRSSDRY